MDFFYLSQVLKRPVLTNRGERLGRIKDLVARLEALNVSDEVSMEEFPPISGLVVQIGDQDIFIPSLQLRALGPSGAELSTAKVDWGSFQRRQGEVLLYRDILDKQLIDRDGRRVVRANDLQLYSSDGVVRVAAVDVSVGAVLRRLAFGRVLSDRTESRTLKPKVPGLLRRRAEGGASLIQWADIEPLKSDVPDVRLRLPHERLALLHPVDLAHIADELGRRQAAEIIESLDDETAAETLQEMSEERQADIVESLDHERAADILEEMDPDDAADLLGDLDETHAEDLLRRMDREEAQDVEELLAYPEKSAGGMMTSEFVTVPAAYKVDDAIAFMRGMEDPPDVIDYLYVVEEEHPSTHWEQMDRQGAGKLLGIVSLRDLILSPADRPLAEIMDTDVVSVTADESQDKASRLMAEYNLLALPVLDDRERIRGIITVDDAMEVLLPEPWLKRLPQVFG
jgi:magnesium transporter